MKETPEWLRGVIDGGKLESEEQMTQAQKTELIAIRQVVIDCAPEGFERKLDQDKIDDYRKEISLWNNQEIVSFCENNDVWTNPSFARALMDAITEKITPVFKENGDAEELRDSR